MRRFKIFLVLLFLIFACPGVTVAQAASPNPPSTAAKAPPLPCNQKILDAVTRLAISSVSVGTGIPGIVEVFVPTQPGLIMTDFINDVQLSGFEAQTWQEAVAWLEHAGFKYSGSKSGEQIYTRSKSWSPGTNFDNCGDPPTSGPPKLKVGDVLDALEKHYPVAGFGLVGCIVLIYRLSRQRRRSFA